MKKLIMIILVAVGMNLLADEWYDESTGFTWYYTISGDAATLTGCSPKEGKLPPLPSILGGKSVKAIGNYAFNGCSGFTGSLTIPDSVTMIDLYAFSGCSGFTGSLKISDSVTTIGDFAFNGCSGFTGSLKISDSVTTIGSYAFRDCSGFTGSLTIPDSVTTIRSYAFSGCSGFTGSLTIPDGVTTIGSSAFSGCSGFTGSLTIPDSVTTIDSYAFRGCSGFTGSLTVGNSVLTIGSEAFSGCSGFTGSLTIGNSVMTINGYAFRDCSGFTGSLTIPDSVTTIGNSAFHGCSGLTGSLMIPNSVTTIGDSAFNGCSGFTGSLKISDSVTTIGNSAFNGCSGFTGSLTIPDSVTTIGSSAFSGCSGFTGSLTIGNSVTTINNYAFDRCSGFTDVIFKGLPPSVGDRKSIPTLTPFFLEKYAVEWKRALAHKNLREPLREGVPVAKVISAKMRESDPTIMDVIYKVTSTKPTVKVRALAFQDGERSFAKVVRPETFVEDENGNPTAGNIGDGVTANEEHTLSWKVSADWNATLAKVKFEVLAVEDEILPLELVTLSKTETQPKMVFSWNYVVPVRAFDALLWLYADKDLGLTLTDGVLKNGDVRLADGASCDKTSYDALVYIYGKMGYELLQGERLDYVRERSRLDLPGISERQYAVKVIEE